MLHLLSSFFRSRLRCAGSSYWAGQHMNDQFWNLLGILSTSHWQGGIGVSAARLGGSFWGMRGPSHALVWLTFAFLHIDGICFVRVHSLSMSRIQDVAVLPRCCSIYVSTSSIPAAFPGFNRLRPVASSPRLKGLVSSDGGWLLLGAIGETWCKSPTPPWTAKKHGQPSVVTYLYPLLIQYKMVYLVVASITAIHW